MMDVDAFRAAVPASVALPISMLPQARMRGVRCRRA